MVNYTYSRTVDNNTTSLVNDRSFYQTVSSRDRTHILRVAGNWELPFGPGRRFGSNLGPVLRELAGGWSLSARYQRESGVPLSITHPNGRPVLLRNPALDGSVGDRLGDQLDAESGVPLNPYFDITAFEPLASSYIVSPEPPVLDELRGPPSALLDAVLTKEIPIRGGLRAALRLEAYALTNSPIFSPPGTNMADQANFGVITSAGGSFAGRIIGVDGARVVQIALEVRF
ncbi:MAG: hypothetical protein GEU99_07700 [Luteitalea sp.]|nr:hypothetical protein [Luteitalea sp.]